MTVSISRAAEASVVRANAKAAQRVRELIEYHVLANATPATEETIRRNLTTPDIGLLLEDDEPLDAALTSALAGLVHDGHVVEVPGGYAPSALPADVSRTARVLSLCGRAALFHGRAVLPGDVWRYATTYARGDVDVGALTLPHVQHDLSSLTSQKRVVVIARVRGEHSRGRNLVVPQRFVTDDATWLPAEPLTWLEYVSDAMRRMLTHGARDAFTAKELRDFLIHDVAARAAQGRPTPVGDTSPHSLRTSLHSLGHPRDPVVRQIPGRSAVWMRVSHSPVVSTAPPPPAPYASDADRLVEAARRAALRTGSIVVTAHDIRDQLAADPLLGLVNGERLAKAMSGVTRARKGLGAGRGSAHLTRRLRRIGLLDGKAAYWVSTGVDNAASFEAARNLVASRGVFADMESGRYRERLAQLKTVQSPVIATGRARQLLDELARMQLRVRALSSTTDRRDDRLTELKEHLAIVKGWLKFRAARAPGMPSDIEHRPTGLTALALQNLFAPVSERSASFVKTRRTLYPKAKTVRRFPNPMFEGRRSGNQQTGSMFLFDQVSALCYAARLWGGPTCQLLVLGASEELGDLRDARYVYAALESAPAFVRQRLVCTLALLQPAEATAVLLAHVQNDTNAGVRECAMWALGMVLGAASTPVLTEAVQRDPDGNVRRAARTFLSMGDHWWWRA